MSSATSYWVLQKTWGDKEKFGVTTIPDLGHARVFEFSDHVRISKYDWERIKKELENAAQAKKPADTVADGDEAVPPDTFEMRSIY